MNPDWKSAIGRQFGAAMDMLENAMTACPDNLWGDRGQQPEFWYLASHSIFWIDFYLSEFAGDFHPPEPFDLVELDPAGVLPDRVYSKAELVNYLNYCREKCRRKISEMTDEDAATQFPFAKKNISAMELLLYNMRHVQHHAAQLNLLLRKNTNSAPRWICYAKETPSENLSS